MNDNATHHPPLLRGLTPWLTAVFAVFLLVPVVAAQGQDSGTVVGWGHNQHGESDPPEGLHDVVQIAGGGVHSLALLSNGTVEAWGSDGNGQASVPSDLEDVVQIAAGDMHSLALRADGTVVAWGDATWGATHVPSNLEGVMQISAGGFHSLALREDSTIVAWGLDVMGQATVPTDLVDVVAVSAGAYHSTALRSDGTVVAWGDNIFGQLDVPSDLDDVVQIAASGFHSVALRSDGTVVAWGDNEEGQTNVPADLDDAVQISASSGGYHTLALRADGTIAAWGLNVHGQSSVPSDIGDVIYVAAGGGHSLAVVHGQEASPEAAINPESLTFHVNPDEQVATHELTISNVADAGAMDLEWTVVSEAASQSSRAHFPADRRTVVHKDDPNVSAGLDPDYQMEGTSVTGALRGDFGVPAFSTTGYTVVGYVNIDAEDPSNMTVVNSSQPTNVYAAAFIDNDLEQKIVLASDGGDVPAHTLGTIDTATGDFDVLGTIAGVSGTNWATMSWDPTTGTLYAVNSNELYTIDPVAVEATLVGPITGPDLSPGLLMITSAISPTGQMYGIDISDDVLLAIDKETGDAVVVGPLGFDANFAQDMDFDVSTGVLYWAAYGGGGNSQIMTIDLDTGTASPVGPVPGGSELLSFTVATSGTPVCGNDGPDWLTVSPDSGSTAPGESDVVVVEVDGEGLAEGTHEAALCVTTNDPDNPMLIVDVTVHVETISDEPGANPVEFALAQNYPNPFAASTTIEFALPEAGPVTIEVFDLAGRLVTTLVDGEMEAGNHSTTWNANGVASGVYLYRIQAGSFSQTLRALVVR